jgi:hypothetical protein
MKPAEVAAEKTLLVMFPAVLNLTGALHGVVSGHELFSDTEISSKRQ